MFRRRGGFGKIAVIAFVVFLFFRTVGGVSEGSGVLDFTPLTPKSVNSGMQGSAEPYKRDMFGDAWTDNNDADMGRNGCDTRNDILKRDLKNVKMSGRCKVLSGTLVSPYTDSGTQIRFVRGSKKMENMVDIDHKIPLHLAYGMGANKWDEKTRVRFANDPDNLIAVDARSNRAKGDKGLSSWMPENQAYKCKYVEDFLMVAEKYDLTLLPEDARTAKKITANCK